MTARTRVERLVRYVSPFGSPAWMRREQAEALLRVDDRRWLRYEALGILTPEQREVGLPRIEVAP